MESTRYFHRILNRMKVKSLEQSVIHADETVIYVLKEEGRSSAAKSRMASPWPRDLK